VLAALVAGVIGSMPVVKLRGKVWEPVVLGLVLVAVVVLTAVKTYTPFIYQKF